MSECAQIGAPPYEPYLKLNAIGGATREILEPFDKKLGDEVIVLVSDDVIGWPYKRFPLDNQTFGGICVDIEGLWLGRVAKNSVKARIVEETAGFEFVQMANKRVGPLPFTPSRFRKASHLIISSSQRERFDI